MKVYFDGMGGWSTDKPVEIDFSSYPDTHYMESFDWVSDYLLENWAFMLAEYPHAYIYNEQHICETCDRLVDKFLRQ